MYKDEENLTKQLITQSIVESLTGLLTR